MPFMEEAWTLFAHGISIAYRALALAVLLCIRKSIMSTRTIVLVIQYAFFFWGGLAEDHVVCRTICSAKI